MPASRTWNRDIFATFLWNSFVDGVPAGNPYGQSVPKVPEAWRQRVLTRAPLEERELLCESAIDCVEPGVISETNWYGPPPLALWGL